MYIESKMETDTAISYESIIAHKINFLHLHLVRDTTVLEFYNSSKIKPLGFLGQRVFRSNGSLQGAWKGFSIVFNRKKK